MTKLSSRSIAVAEAIRDCETFQTYGALHGEVVTSLGSWDSGRLSGVDLDLFREDMEQIRYVVWSYVTPIAWWCEDKGWTRVAQRFSVTTSKHQGRLYLI